MRSRAKKALDESGIEIPFPHLTLRLAGNADEAPGGAGRESGAATGSR
jgi:small-conductance mechanosensitive channel